jgi:hypothetical protein
VPIRAVGNEPVTRTPDRRTESHTSIDNVRAVATRRVPITCDRELDLTSGAAARSSRQAALLAATWESTFTCT